MEENTSSCHCTPQSKQPLLHKIRMLKPLSSLVALVTWSIHIRYSQHDSALISMLWNRSFLWILLRIKSTYALASETLVRKMKTYMNKIIQMIQKMCIILLLILYLLFLVHIMILLRLANTMVEPRRLNSAISWTEIISILKPNKWVQYKSTQIIN